MKSLVRTTELSPVERELPAQQALDNIQQWLAKQSINTSIYTTDCARVASVQLTTSHGLPLATGHGRGAWPLVGAYFEAFEHLMLEKSASSLTVQFSLDTWLTSTHCHQQCLFGQALQDDYQDQDEEITFSFYHSLSSANQYLIPDLLTNPFYPRPSTYNAAFCFLKRYTSKSGWASGSTFKETVLHGANELIADHYLSEMYKQYIGFTEYTGEFIRILPPNKIVETYRPYIIDIDQMTLVMCETQFGSYFCVCVLPSSLSPMALRATGVSYCQYHAIERAVSGVVQILETYDGQALKNDLDAAKFLNKYSKLSQLTELSKLDRLPCVVLSQIQPDQRPFQEHYQFLLKSIKSQGYDLLAKRAFHQDDIWLTSIYIPGLERFNIIDKGTWVVPLPFRGTS